MLLLSFWVAAPKKIHCLLISFLKGLKASGSLVRWGEWQNYAVLQLATQRGKCSKCCHDLYMIGGDAITSLCYFRVRHWGGGVTL